MISVGDNKWLNFILKCIPFILIFTAGVYIGYHFMPTKTVTKVETKVETKYVEVEGKHTTEIKYVQKDSPKDADVVVKNNNPKVEVNGKQYTFEKLPDEKYKFEQGKLQVEQGYTFKIDASALVPKQPKWGVDIGYSNHGVVVGAKYNFNKNVSVGVFGVPKPKESRDKFIGGGLTINF